MPDLATNGPSPATAVPHFQSDATQRHRTSSEPLRPGLPRRVRSRTHASAAVLFPPGLSPSLGSVRALGLSSRAAAVSVVVGALPGLLYVWSPWRGEPDPCTTLEDGTRACMPMVVVPPPLWAYLAFACGGAVVALLVTVASLHVRRQLP